MWRVVSGAVGDPNRVCAVCGDPVGNTHRGRPWVMLNRFAVGTGTSRSCREIRDADGDVLWDPAHDRAAGALLCWPACLYTYFEGVMIETNHEMARRGPGETP